MIEHLKGAEIGMGAVVASAATIAAQLTSMSEAKEVLGLVSIAGGIAVSLLALYIRHLIREREDERRTREEEREERLRQRFERIEQQVGSLSAKLDKELVQMLLDIGEKYAQRTDIFSQLGKVEAKADAAHHRLDKGTDTLAEHDRRIAVIESKDRSAKFRRGEGTDG